MASLISQVLKARGLSDTTDLENFLKPTFENPFMMSGMRQAVTRIEQAIKNGEKITVFGDYDVDGVSATAIMFRTLSDLGASVDTYIPKRSEGYGLNSSALQDLAKKGTNLLITVDTGIGNEKEISEISDAYDVIVTDHHLVPEGGVPSAVAVLNPHQKGDIYPNKNLSGAGVAFKLSQALRNQMTGADLQSTKNIELAALATIADVVPLVGENRKIVSDGLAAMVKSQDKAIMALLSTTNLANKKTLTAEDIGFGVAPRVNAAGRIDNPAAALSLFTLDQQSDITVFQDKAKYLSTLNETRRTLEEEVVTTAEEKLVKLRQEAEGDISSIIIENQGWHEGVVGLAAAKLVDRHKLPSIILTSNDGKIYHGSARSVPGFNIVDALSKTESLLIKYGGHEQAAGLTIAAENIPKFREAFDDYARDNLPVTTPKIEEIPIDLSAGISLDDVKELEKELGPFGVGNERPVFSVSSRSVSNVRTSNDGKHLFFDLDNTRAVAFRAGHLESFVKDSNVDLSFSLGVNNYKGKESVQANISDIRPAFASITPPSDDTLKSIHKFLGTKKDSVFNPGTLAKEFEAFAGTIISVYDFNIATKILEELGLFSANLGNNVIHTYGYSDDINFVGSRTYRAKNGLFLPIRKRDTLPFNPVVTSPVVQDTVMPASTTQEEVSTVTENITPEDIVTLAANETATVKPVIPDTLPVPEEISDEATSISPAVQDELSVVEEAASIVGEDSTKVAKPVREIITADPKIAQEVEIAKQSFTGKKKIRPKKKEKQAQEKPSVQTKPSDSKSAKRSKEFLDRIDFLVKLYRYPSSSKRESLDDILLRKIRAEDLKDQIPDSDQVDTKTYTSTLLRLKEEQAERDLEALIKTINKVEPKLGKQLVDIKLGDIEDTAIQENLKNQYKKGNISATGIFYDEELAKTRIRKRTIKRKDGTEYTRDTTAETTLNEWLRQLSDTKYPGVTRQVKDLRKRYLELSGQEDYKQPSSTLHRETVVLREKIGKLLISGKTEIEEELSSFSKADQSLVYRRIADKITSLDNGALSAEQESVINRLLFNLNTDIEILESYRQIAKVVGLKERPATSLSSRDKIEFYRKYLSGRLGEVKGNQSIDKLSPGYLDLISANREKDPKSYNAAKKELISAKKEGLWDARIKKFSDSKTGKNNLAIWLKHANASIEENLSLKEKLFSSTTDLERFNELLEDPKYRGIIPRVSYERAGKQHVRMTGTWFNGKLYRIGITGIDDIDAERLAEDTNAILEPLYDSIRESRNRIVAARGLNSRDLADQIISLRDSLSVDPAKEDDFRPKRFQGLQRLYNFMQRDPTLEIQDKIKEKGYDAGVRKAIYLEEKLKIEADIYEADPNARILLDSSLYGDVRLSALRDIRTNKQWAAADVKGLSDGLFAPDFVANLPVEKQLEWWQTAVNNVGQLSGESFEDVQERLRNLESSKRKNYLKSLPKDYIIEVKGAAAEDPSTFYRTTVDKEALDNLEKELNDNIQKLFEQSQEGLTEHYNKRLEDLDKRRKILEGKDVSERTKEETDELTEISTVEEDIKTKLKAVKTADSPVKRIDQQPITRGQNLSWKKQSEEILRLQRDIRDIIPSVSFKDIFDEREKDTKVDKKTKYSNRVIALREIRDELKTVQKESFEDFQKRVADLGSLPAWLPKHSLIKIGKEEGQDVRYYRTFVEEDTQKLDKEIQKNLDTISKADEKIQEIFKEQVSKKLEYLQKQEQQYPTPDESERKQAIERLKERSKKLKDQLNAADQIDKIDGYNAKYQVAQRESTNLPTKLKILQADPNYHFDEDFKYDTANEVITNIQNDTKALADIKGKYRGYDNEYLSNFKSIKEQLAWWQVFDKEYEWLTDENTTKEEITAAFDNLDSAGRQNYYRILPDNFFNTFFVRKEGFLHRVGRDISKEEASILQRRQKQKLNNEIKKARENVILSTGQETEESTTTTLNQFGESNQSRMATEEVMTKVTAISKLDGDEFSERYGALSAEEKQIYNRNFNEPVKSGTKWYKNIFVMPRDAWVTAEKESGHSTPRIRPGIDEESYYDKSAEAEFQKQVTADIKGRSWDFVPKQKSAVAEQQREPVINSNDVEQPLVQEQQVRQRPPRPVVEKETQSNLSKMLQRLKSPSSLKSIGMMGMAGAFALWNMAMTGPTKEAQEHKRRVEEERRMRQYGY